jgi:hypothetical protein
MLSMAITPNSPTAATIATIANIVLSIIFSKKDCIWLTFKNS